MSAFVKLEPKYIKNLFIQSQSADPSPPLGTVLGNLGVNTVMFCTSFNLFTKTLPTYFLLKVIIYIQENRSATFKINLPSTCYILNLLKFEKTIKIKEKDRLNDKVISCVLLPQILALSKFKFPYLSLEQSFKMVYGSLKSMNIVIVKKN
jgi:large subunit ribosomal protein L11